MKETRASAAAIPLARPFLPPRALELVAAVLASRQLGAGFHAAWCEQYLEAAMHAARVLLTNSGSSALDAACALLELKPGDEVVMPSFAFPSPANAIARTGAVPVFADVDEKRLALDPAKAAAAITGRTRAVIVVHYAGIAADIDSLAGLCRSHGIALIEDAAQAFDSYYCGRALGTFGALGALSFQQSKNIATGEGGALLVNDAALATRAQYIRDKGTNRRDMEAGMIPFYEWVAIGAGIAPNELTAAVIRAQLEVIAEIKARRRLLFGLYEARLAPLALSGRFVLPHVPEGADHNAHCFYLLLPEMPARDALLATLRAQGIGAATHFVPLHSSHAGRQFGRAPDGCPITTSVASRIVRLPLYVDLAAGDVERICDAVTAACRPTRSPRARSS
jgi:dTDP-4-amino-4,6-dideoxygalactose transaminase